MLAVSFELLKSVSISKTEYDKDDLSALGTFVLSREKVRAVVELNLEFTNPKRIQGLNRRFRGVDRNTDVIAFRSPHPLSFSLGEKDGLRDFVGDIAINVDQARLAASLESASIPITVSLARAL